MKITVRLYDIKDLFGICFVLLLIPPSFIQIDASIYRSYLIFQCMIGLFILVLIVLKGYIDSFLWLVMIFYGLQVISTLISNFEYWPEALRESLCSLSIIFFFVYIVKNKNGRMLSDISLVFSIYVILNSFLTYLKPDLFGVYTPSRIDQYIYFLGIKNQMAATLVPFLAYIVFYNYLIKGKRNLLTFILLFLGFITEVHIDSGTGYIAIFAMIILYIIYNSITEHALSLSRVFLLFLLINILIVFMQVLINNTSLGSFLTTVLHRDITLSNRTTIWSMALQRFSHTPWLGLGKQLNKNMVTFYARNQWDTNSNYSAHNVLLQTLLESGIVSMIPLIGAIVLCIKKNKSYVCDLMHIIIIGLCGILISFLAEAYDLTYLFVTLSFVYEFSYIDNISSIYKGDMNAC